MDDLANNDPSKGQKILLLVHCHSFESYFNLGYFTITEFRLK